MKSTYCIDEISLKISIYKILIIFFSAASPANLPSPAVRCWAGVCQVVMATSAHAELRAIQIAKAISSWASWTSVSRLASYCTWYSWYQLQVSQNLYILSSYGQKGIIPSATLWTSIMWFGNLCAVAHNIPDTNYILVNIQDCWLSYIGHTQYIMFKSH